MSFFLDQSLEKKGKLSNHHNQITLSCCLFIIIFFFLGEGGGEREESLSLIQLIEPSDSTIYESSHHFLNFL